jgi:hypothetical protein
MSVVPRRVPAIPVRTSTQTWTRIVALLTAPEHAARDTLTAISNTAAMLISEEYTADSPIVVLPMAGPRVRIYTVHGTAAIDADDEDVPPLASWPMVEPGWRLSLPCGIDDIDEVRAALQSYPDIEVRDTTEGLTVDATEAVSTGTVMVTINYSEMERP